MRKILSGIAILSFMVAYTQVAKKQTDLQEYGVKGKVKLVKEILYDAVEKQGKVQKGSRIGYVAYEFDQAGNVLQKESGYRKKTYKYDNKNNKIEESQHTLEGELVWKKNINTMTKAIR